MKTIDADKILMVVRSLRICAGCEEETCRPGCTELEVDSGVELLADIIEQQRSGLSAAHARIAELEVKLEAKEMDYSALQESYINSEMNLNACNPNTRKQ